MLVAMSLSWYKLGRFSNSRPGMVPARRRIHSVGNLRWLFVSKASEGSNVEFGYESVDVGVGGEAPFRVFVHGDCEVLDAHLGGSFLDGEEFHTGLFKWALDLLR
jgi:hypothetical protein